MLQPGILRTTIILSSLILTSCGGGDDSDNQIPTDPNAIENVINDDPSKYSQGVLIANFSNYAFVVYEGQTNAVEPTLLNLQRFMRYFIGKNAITVPHIGKTLADNSVQLVNNEGIVDGSNNCEFGGAVNIKGRLYENNAGNLEIDFHTCKEGSANNSYDGRAVLVTSSDNESSVLLYDNAHITTNIHSSIVSGYTSLYTREQSYILENTLVFDLAGQSTQYLEKLRYSLSAGSTTDGTISGTLYLGDLGYIDVYSNSYLNDRWEPTDGSIQFDGNNDRTSELRFEEDKIRFLTDTTLDGIYDKGADFDGSLTEFLNADLSNVSMVPVEELD